MISAAGRLANKLVARFGVEAHARFDEILDGLSVVDGAALADDWGFWARPKQKAPLTGWRRWGFLTGRGFGKTIAISKWINDTVERSPTPLLLLLVAQDEQSSIDIQVLGPSGLIATAPPWNRPHWEASALQLVWPNGSRAYVRTPEVPGKIRGLEYHTAWASELQSWPVATREEAWYNGVLLSTRLGAARVVWDSTPKRRHPILRDLLIEHERDAKTFPVVRGTTHENPHLPEGYKEDLERKYAGTSRGREELYGEMLDESENALVKQSWIDAARRAMPDAFVRKAIGVDPAVTARKGSDRTGIVTAGAGVDGQAYVLGDLSGKHAPHEWARTVLDKYFADRVDVVVVETNKGGDLVTQNLRAAAQQRDVKVVVAGKDEKPRHTSRILYVKETHTRGAKEDRAQPLATAYERGRVSHPYGIDLSDLEDTLTTWEPGGKTADGSKSPDQIDAEVLAVSEVLDLASGKPDPRGGFKGIVAASAALNVSASAPESLSTLYSGPGQRL